MQLERLEVIGSLAVVNMIATSSFVTFDTNVADGLVTSKVEIELKRIDYIKITAFSVSG